MKKKPSHSHFHDYVRRIIENMNAKGFLYAATPPLPEFPEITSPSERTKALGAQRNAVARKLMEEIIKF